VRCGNCCFDFYDGGIKMNDRIRQLALQAMTATTNKFSADREWSADEWRDFYDTKFAELIVQECVEIGDNYQEILGKEPQKG
jgi:hypothetical protein